MVFWGRQSRSRRLRSGAETTKVADRPNRVRFGAKSALLRPPPQTVDRKGQMEVLALVLVVGFPGEVSLEVTKEVGADLELRMVERLLDQGPRVLPDLSQASIEFVVSLDSDTSTTVAIPAQPTRLRELGLIQRVVVLVQQATAGSTEATPSPAVVVPVSSALAPGPRRDLIQSLRTEALGLTQEPLEGDISLCVQFVGEQLSVDAAHLPQVCVARRKTTPVFLVAVGGTVRTRHRDTAGVRGRGESS